MNNKILTNHLKNFEAESLALIKSIDYNIKDVEAMSVFYNQMSAYFLYINTLFERFMGDIIKSSIKSNEVVKERYLNMFTSMIEDKISKGNKELKWIEFANMPEKMISNYNIIEKEKHQIVIAKVLFNFNLKNKFVGDIYKKYSEIRERRNLLAHRGKSPDSLYFDILVKKYKVDKNFVNDIFKTHGIFPYSKIFSTEEKSFTYNKQTLDNIFDITPTPRYLHYSYAILHNFSILMLSSCWDHNNEEAGGVLQCHDSIYMTYEKKAPPLTAMYFNLFNHLISLKTFNYSLGIDEKINYVILLKDFINAVAKVDEMKSDLNKFNNLLEGVMDSITNKKEKDPNKIEIKHLAEAYINEDKKNLITATKALIEKGYEWRLMKDWLIFRNYKDDKKILNQFESTDNK